MGRSILLAGMMLIAAMATSSAARADETDPQGMLALAQAAELRGDHRMAVALYQRAQEAFPWESAPLTGWGLLAARLGAAEQAATLLTAALDIDPENRDAATGLADVLVDLGRLDEALPLYEMVLRTDPSDLAAREGRLHVLSQSGTPVEQADPPALAPVTLGQAPAVTQSDPAVIDTSLPAKPSTGSIWR